MSLVVLFVYITLQFIVLSACMSVHVIVCQYMSLYVSIFCISCFSSHAVFSCMYESDLGPEYSFMSTTTSTSTLVMTEYEYTGDD